MENKKEQKPVLAHDIILKDRKDLKLSGIQEVLSVTTNAINLQTNGGPLAISGSNLKIKNLSQDQKEVEIEGEIDEIKYCKRKRKFFEKVFK